MLFIYSSHGYYQNSLTCFCTFVCCSNTMLSAAHAWTNFTLKCFRFSFLYFFLMVSFITFLNCSTTHSFPNSLQWIWIWFASKDEWFSCLYNNTSYSIQPKRPVLFLYLHLQHAFANFTRHEQFIRNTTICTWTISGKHIDMYKKMLSHIFDEVTWMCVKCKIVRLLGAGYSFLL